MVHLTTALDAASGVPLYEQLYRYIRGEIEAGRLAAGERLRAAVGKRLKMHLGENVLGGLDILASRLHAKAGDPPEQDRVEHAQRAEMDVLRHISDELCPLAPRHFQKVRSAAAPHGWAIR